MERLTNRDKEIPLPNADNALFWARVHEKLARYEDAEEQAYFASEPKTYCEKWPTGCMFCDLLLRDGKKEKYEVVTMNKAGIPGEVLTFEYDHKCVPCKPTQPECGECEFAKPQTHADRIRAMTDEELAEFMCHNVSNGTVNCAFCAAAEFCRMGHNGWLDWLKQEVES